MGQSGRIWPRPAAIVPPEIRPRTFLLLVALVSPSALLRCWKNEVVVVGEGVTLDTVQNTLKRQAKN
jgi:hypothetical protein